MTQATFDIIFSTHPAGLKARVRGEGTLENTVAYWRAIVAELEQAAIARRCCWWTRCAARRCPKSNGGNWSRR